MFKNLYHLKLNLFKIVKFLLNILKFINIFIQQNPYKKIGVVRHNLVVHYFISYILFLTKSCNKMFNILFYFIHNLLALY